MDVIQNRKLRQRAERELVFLERAWSMIQGEGVLKLQMSKLAKECEYSVGTLYQHFSSKEDLLVALATSGVAERLALYQRVAAWSGPSRHRMLAILLADVLFAQKEPEYFRLAQYVSTHTVWMSASQERRDAAQEASYPLGDAVESIINDAIHLGDVNPHGVEGRELCVGLWAMAEGMHTLIRADGLLEAYAVPRPYQLLMTHAHGLLNGLNWQPLLPLDDVSQQNQLLAHIMADVFPEFPMTACPVVVQTDFKSTSSNG